MPSSEEKVILRTTQIKKFISIQKKVSIGNMDSWCFLNLGLRPMTAGRYYMALKHAGIVEIDQEKQEISWVGMEN